MMEELKKSNLEEKENLIELQLCAENERKALMEQLGNDKSKLEARWDSLEKGLESLRKERENLEKEKNAVFVEKVRVPSLHRRMVLTLVFDCQCQL
jgi:predicted  nucleic acid-binding Zn-ribbon protein